MFRKLDVVAKRVEKIPERYRAKVEARLAALADALREKRNKLGLSQEELAERLDISHMTVQFLEQRRRFPSLPSFFYICSDLGIDVSIGESAEREILPPSDNRVEGEAFRTLLPLYSLSAAAGHFGAGRAVEPLGWMEVPKKKLAKGMFVTRAFGSSMEPKIHSGDYLVFRGEEVAPTQGKIVLVQLRGQEDPESGGSFTVKAYHSRGQGEGKRVTLKSLNPLYPPIELDAGRAEDLTIVGELLFRL